MEYHEIIPLVKNSLSLSSSAPCPPTTVNVQMRTIGQGHWAMTSWDSVNCSDVEYLALITGRINNNPQTLMEVSSYWTYMTYFDFLMPCSTAYNLSVRARNSAGVSEPSTAFTGVTGNFTSRSFPTPYSSECFVEKMDRSNAI